MSLSDTAPPSFFLYYSIGVRLGFLLGYNVYPDCAQQQRPLQEPEE